MFFYPKIMIYTIKKFLIKIKNLLFLLNFHLKDEIRKKKKKKLKKNVRTFMKKQRNIQFKKSYIFYSKFFDWWCRKCFYKFSQSSH